MNIFSVWLLMSAATTTASADSFDIICEGTRTYGTTASAPVGPGSFNQRLRVSFAEMKWCTDDCRVMFRIDDVLGDEVILMRSRDKGVMSYSRLNTGTGDFYRRGYGSVPGIVVDFTEQGKCLREPFSGFPPRQ